MTTLKPKKGILVIISGAAGTGKGTVIGCLMKNSDRFAYSVSATTREPRPGEVNGREYHFLTRGQFEQNIADDNVIEYTEYCGNYYGTLKSELSKLESGKNLILEIEVQGAMRIKKLYPESVAIFVLPPDYETLRNRLINRGTNASDDIENRLKTAIGEFSYVKYYDYAVVNNDGESDTAAAAIENIMCSEQHRVFRTPEAIDELFRNKFNIK